MYILFSPSLQGEPGEVISIGNFGQKGAVGLPGLPGVPVSFQKTTFFHLIYL